MNQDEIDRIILNDFTNEFTKGYINVGPENTPMPVYYNNFAESIQTFPVRDNDVFVTSYLKAGTTWTQEMVWLIMHDCDFEGAKIKLHERFPFLEVCTLLDCKKSNQATDMECPEFIYDSVEYVKKQASPRCIKTHLPFSLLPQEIQNKSKSPKIVYVMRNPKDVCVSYYHHGNILQGWKSTFENFCKVFLSEKSKHFNKLLHFIDTATNPPPLLTVMYGSFWKHVLGYWQHRAMPNLLIITYEDMKKDLPSVIRRVAQFLNKALTEQQIEMLTEHLSFESMKNNKAVNFQDIIEAKIAKKIAPTNASFMRSGKVGNHKQEMSAEIIEKIDTLTKQRISGTGFDRAYGYIL